MFVNRIKLADKMILGLVVIVLVLLFVSLLSLHTLTWNSAKDDLVRSAKLVASMVDGDKLEKLKSGDEDKPEFIRLRDDLRRMRRALPDVKYIYTYRPNNDKSIRFIVDSEYGFSYDSVKIDETYSDITKEMLAGFSGSSVDSAFSSDKWGTFLSAYAPVYDSSGKFAGAVGVDITRENIIKGQLLLAVPFIFVIAVAAVLAIIAVHFFNSMFIEDLRKILEAANEINAGNIRVKLNIKRNDELGELAMAITSQSERMAKITEEMEALGMMAYEQESKRFK